MSERPNSELVAIAWLKGVPALPTGQVGTTLPADETKYPNGFLQVAGVGGSPKANVPVRRPVVRVSCWMPTSSKPRFGEAANLAERVIEATFGADGHGQTGRVVFPGPGDYMPARVMSIFPVSEPTRVPDPAGMARYDVDLELHWSA